MTLHKNMVIQLQDTFPFSKREFPSKIKSCFYIMHREFLGSFPGYTIFNCKFKIDECFLLMKHC